MKNRLFVWAIAIVGFFLSAVIAATLYPWMMVVISIGVGASAIAFLMNPQVQLAVEERFPLLATHPKCKGVVAGITGYCVLLFCFSVSTISTNWQVQSRNQRVATSIADAEKALSDGELDRADDLTRKLESERGTKDSSPLDRLRAQVDAARSARGVRQANDRLLQIVIAANQDLLAKQYGKVESALIEAFKMPRATEFQEAQQLANRLLLQYVNSAKDRLEANDLTTAAALARAGEQLPGVTDKAALIDLRVQIANRRVAAKVASASDHARAKRWKAAERELNDALSIEYANELVAARTLVSEVMSELGRSANPELEKHSERHPSEFSFVKSRLEAEGNIMELYAFSGQLDSGKLKTFCTRRMQRCKAKVFYYVVVFDESRNAKFPNNPFISGFRGDENALRHIRAIYEFNRDNGYSELEYYDTNALEGTAKRMKI